MDALPIIENTKEPFTSKNIGKHHACGIIIFIFYEYRARRTRSYAFRSSHCLKYKKFSFNIEKNKFVNGKTNLMEPSNFVSSRLKKEAPGLGK